MFETLFFQSEKQNRKRCIKYFADVLHEIKHSHIIVTDSDETVSMDDTSNIFFETSGLLNKKDKIKEIFKTHGITYDGFARAYTEYLSIPENIFKNACTETTKKAKIRQDWSSFLEHNTTPIIFVTAGIMDIWKQIIKYHKWQNIILIGSHDNIIISPSVKGDLIKKLKKNDKKVLAFGDSRLDCPMLIESNVGYVIPNIRGSIGVSNIVKNYPHIRQITMEYPKIPDVQSCMFKDAIKSFFDTRY